jgi:ubiquinone/menaquinone biosynthesis C-methylase UbiE
MEMIRKLKITIYNLLRNKRCDIIKSYLNADCRSVLDIGCRDLYFKQKLEDQYDITIADINPINANMKQEDVQNLSFKDNEFDIILCQQVLEHIPNPVQAMRELKRVAKRQLVISVPNEPVFSNLRLGIWEKEHLWAVTNQVLEYHIGKPDVSRNIIFNRYHVSIWNFQ